ncbi:ArsR/SmtB family transcription factor [Haloarchaeobius amylolyticus]|uniref:ArsR/SmtB family transcription factor n=1 Tax=Haloarchaeobius amylolyticus TaxID=1198296 RepID=UPI00226F44E5|nr:metalloregulator ArsR/SmtB family transcription factor [Haloarchaeobius amylolyticus]
MTADSTSPEAIRDDVFHALAAEPRRRLLLLLATDEAAVGELAAEFDISRPAISEHLAVLKRAGLVSARKEGRRRIYSLEADSLAAALSWFVELDEFWAGHLEEVGSNLNGEQ